MNPSGEQYELTAGEYSATITEVGARLRRLTYAGRPLVVPYGEDELPPVYRGAVLAPWPNRIADGSYSFGGEAHQLPLTEPERMTALHGLVVWNQWHLCAAPTSPTASPNRVSMRCRIWPQQGYPFLLDLTVSYELGVDGLTVALTATNNGKTAAPYGCSIHPYLVAGEGRADDWTLLLAAREYLDVDARLLPVSRNQVAHTSMDLTTNRPIGSRKIDHAFTALTFDETRHCRARLLHPDGHGVQMTWDDACRWVQVHTADRPEPHYDRVGVVIEPMTCPPDAFRTGEGVIALEPGRATRARWRIAAI